MNQDLLLFLKHNGLDNVEDFRLSMNSKITARESVISNYDLFRACYDEPTEVIVPISKIVGFDRDNLKFDNEFFNNFSNFFDSKSGDMYHKRSLSLLNIPAEEVMKELDFSFTNDPIKTISVDNDYFISDNGLHRFMALKLYYMVELYNGKTPQELNEKYQIRVINKNVDVFKTYASAVGALFNPPIVMSDKTAKQDWLIQVKDRMNAFENNIAEYELLISNIAFTFFRSGEPGEAIIRFLKEYFPNLFKDVISKVCASSYYESVVEIVDCAEKYFWEESPEISKIINQYLIQEHQKPTEHVGYKYFDLTADYNDYGQIKDITNKTKSQRDLDLQKFSEGSVALETCLKVLWKKGIKTIACCKGDHLSIGFDNKPVPNYEAYIAFDSNSEWLSYLSPLLIQDENVMILKDAIYYFGDDKNYFFNTLTRDILFGKKENKKLLNTKIGKGPTFEVEYKSVIHGLQKMGLDEDQIKELSKSYLKIDELSRKFYSTPKSSKKTIDLILEEWHKFNKVFEDDLLFYINRNNERVQSGMKL